MKTKKLLLGALGCFVVSFIIAAIWHLILFKDLYHDLGAFGRQEPIVIFGFIDNVLKSLVMAFVYPLGYKGGSPIKEGLRFGVFMGVLVGSTWVLEIAGTQPVTSISTWLILESTFVLLQFGVAGMAIGLIYGKEAH